MQQVNQTFTGSTCFLLKTAINHLTKQWKAEHTDVDNVNMEVCSKFWNYSYYSYFPNEGFTYTRRDMFIKYDALLDIKLFKYIKQLK